MPFPYYENHEFSVINGTTDYDLAAEQPTFRDILSSAGPSGEDPTRVEIRTNNTITVKLNKTTNPAITIASTDSPYVIDAVQIWNMYITNNSGAGANVKLMFQQSPYIAKP